TCLSVFFQAEDGIRDFHVTGVQTCALPISETASRTTRSCGRTGTRESGLPVASRMAATIAGVEESVGGSPAPRSPYGAAGSGFSRIVSGIGGTSRIVGIR